MAVPWQWCLNSCCLEFCWRKEALLQLALAALSLDPPHSELLNTVSLEGRPTGSVSAILDLPSFVHWVDTVFPCLEPGQGLLLSYPLCGVLPTPQTEMGLKHRGEINQWNRSNCGPQIIHEPLERKHWKSEVLSRNMVHEIPFRFYINVANLWPNRMTCLHFLFASSLNPSAFMLSMWISTNIYLETTWDCTLPEY